MSLVESQTVIERVNKILGLEDMVIVTVERSAIRFFNLQFVVIVAIA